jgi:enoyl-CoA hydratase/carnithine racemase
VQVDQTGEHANVATLMLEQPGKPVVVLDRELLQRLLFTLDSLPGGLRGLVIASASERAFVAGADLKSISELSDEQLHTYLQYGSRVFGKIASLPYPTAAAICGAALGGGLELAMHCDGLIGAPPPLRDGQPGRPYPIGLPEAGLGICPGWGGSTMFAARVDPADAIRRTAAGTPFQFEEAVKAGLFDEVAAEASAVIAAAKGWVTRQKRTSSERDGAPLRHAGRGDRSADVVQAIDAVRAEVGTSDTGRAVVAAMEAAVGEGWYGCLKVEQRELVRLRHTPRAKELIEAFFAKSRK